ncbi:small-subunit processome [Conidiobolus coronatus NRRL 28638]|uniref:Small-subunit processome n=1 Tax=Conidiobolus coronatus (strain ATCC 28846 / CBS 209.66 / NRRL 28638) TaxID=796925 RepID=A0A137P3S2_CONC2|nr:small-subunit processome [Conidiobolus coronatus NRRL 28638]|eukprot:KXN69667.1 small-subunit processome [Conidiobolus coronatus NRRL 28638]
MATLKAPKVKRLQDKIIRTAAYEESKEQISQWETIVKENREKEHLSYTQTDSQAVQPKSTNVLINHTKVENDMEREIYEALQSHNIQDKNLKNFEDLQSQELSAQELKDRQKKMMQLRNLMFKEELKAKRVSKIKSKAYRKVLRKEKAKLAKLQGEADGDDDMEDSDEEATKNEIARARERMSLKHQNTTKWAKNLMKHGGRESESHQAITEQLQEHERLKQKIIGKSGEDEESEDDYDELDNGTIDTSDKKQVINFAFNELNKIIDDEEEEKPAKGIMGMKFMQKALERQKKETEELAQQAQEDLRLLNRDSDEDYTHGQSESEDEDDTKHRKVVQGNEGRLQFTGVGANAEEQDNLPIPTKKDKKKSNNKSTKAPKLQVTKNGVYSKTTDEDDNSGDKFKSTKASTEEEESNPWLSHQDDLPLAGIKSKKNQGGQLSQTEKASLKLSKAKSSAKDKEETNLSKVKVNASQTLSNIIYPEDENNEDGGDKEPTVVHSSKLTSFNQRELVEMAFANDDVVQEFEQEKQQVIESQTAKDEDITLPGWGSWGGENRKPKKRLFKQAKPGSGIDQDKRKDRKLNHVIINEVHNPKLEKYTVRGVPSQYRSQEEFEQTMRGAIGKEWNPTTTYHKAIKPKVLVTKVGKVIDPIKAPFKP